jgi:hypothetical protein
MKHLILFLSLLFLQQADARVAIFQDGEAIAKAKAKELTKKYQTDLELDSSQSINFEKIITGYIIRRLKIKELNVSDGDKKVMVKQLNIQENEDMAAMLSKGQYKKYLKAQIKLQP